MPAHSLRPEDITTDRPRLSARHQQQLQASGIAAEVAAERGYRTVSASDPRLAGFKEYQRADGILIPVRPPDGSNGRYQLRRDRDRVRTDGSKAKYEQAAGDVHRLDVHPRFHARLSDPTVPLWIGEGVKKGDALASQGQVVVSLGGVDCGLTPACREDWDLIELRGRTVLICFDYDPKPTTQKNVAAARDRLAAFLTERGARVRVVEPPPAPNGEKQGVDDFLAAGGDLVALLAARCADWSPPAAGGAAGCGVDCPAARELAELRKLERARGRLLTTGGPKARRAGQYVTLVQRYYSDRDRATLDPENGQRTPLANAGGFLPLKLQAIAKETGHSYSSLKAARDELIDAGVFEAYEAPVEIGNGYRTERTFVRAGGSLVETIAALVPVVTAKPPDGRTWGGARWTCPNNPTHRVKTRHVCDECPGTVDAVLVEASSVQVEHSEEAPFPSPPGTNSVESRHSERTPGVRPA